MRAALAIHDFWVASGRPRGRFLELLASVDRNALASLRAKATSNCANWIRGPESAGLTGIES